MKNIFHFYIFLLLFLITNACTRFNQSMKSNNIKQVIYDSIKIVDDGKLWVSDKSYDYKEVNNKKIYLVAEQMPEFPGGDVEMMKYMSSNWRIPEEQIPLLIRRSVAARFYVDTDGSINEVKIVRSTANNVVDSCFIELIKNMPKWESGKQDGKPVPVYFTIPLHFSLQGDR